VNRATGSVAWNYFADDQIKQSAVVTADRKLVFVSNKGTLYGFNLNALASPATPAWQIALPDTAPSPLAVDAQGYIYVGTSAGNLIKLLLPANESASIVWKTSLGSQITSSPVIDANGIVYSGSINSKLHAVNSQTGTIKWDFTTKGPIRSTPTISDIGNIYAANDSGEVYALDTIKNVLWRYQIASAISAPLLHYKSHLYVGTLGRQIIRLYGREDSAGVTGLTKQSLAVQSSAQPMWSTFQGNSQRTGMASGSGITGIKNTDHQIPNDFMLLQNYPNPFNPSTTIKYELPHDGRVSIKVFNMLGQQLLMPVDKFQNAGSYEVTFDTKSLSSGIYFYQMTAGSFVQTKKMVLMK
jgi:outer membrane protein assembly factor BamB